MLLKIDFKPEDVVYEGKGRIIVKCKYYAQFASVLHLATTEGSTKEDFDEAPKTLRARSIFVGQRGGISF